jgi:hypothetical protein
MCCACACGCRHVPGNLYRDKQGADPDAACNELVIRIQPKEAIYLKINNKVCLCVLGLLHFAAASDTGGWRGWEGNSFALHFQWMSKGDCAAAVAT